jgi:hypothetical protein
MGAALLKRPVLWAGVTLLFGLLGAAWGLAVDSPVFIRGGVALAVSGAPLPLLVQQTYARAFAWGRVNALLALAWAALAVASFGLWRWAGDPVYANALAWVCGTFALMTTVCAWLGVKYPGLPPVHLPSVPESPGNKDAGQAAPSGASAQSPPAAVSAGPAPKPATEPPGARSLDGA